jgi:hypothetical protein
MDLSDGGEKNPPRILKELPKGSLGRRAVALGCWSEFEEDNERIWTKRYGRGLI